MANTHPLDGARSVVTGAGSGLGRAFVLALAKRRGRILVSDVDLDRARETAELARVAGAEVEIARCDVRQASEVEALARQMETRFGGTDVVVNNAGVATLGRVGEIPLEDWRWIVDINLLGVVHGCHTFVPRLRKQGRGFIVNVASAAGLFSLPAAGAYNATKAAVVALSETLKAELHGEGVHLTVLCPTFFQTQILHDARVHAASKEAEQASQRMRRARLDADAVAGLALEAVVEDRLYCVPMADGRWAWRLKRAIPGFLPGAIARVVPFLPK